MDADKMAQIQLQVRKNQTELHDFIRDLDNWENDMKGKDENLKTQKTDDNQSLPPVRNSLQKKKKKKKKKSDPDKPEDNDPKSKTKRIKAYDYRAWDKFDVVIISSVYALVKDKACEEVGGQEEQKSSSDYETDEEWEVERCRQQAIALKDQGNRQFKNGQLDEALDSYTRGMVVDPLNALLPANRAMVLLKQDKLAAAETDCTSAISLDPTYIKAYLRRGTARAGLKKYEDAKKDFQHVLKLESSNRQAKNELEKIEKILHPPVDEDSGIVKAVFKKPSERSKKPLRRIVIEEIGVDTIDKEKEIAEITAGQSKTSQDITAKDNKIFEQFTQKNKSQGESLVKSDGDKIGDLDSTSIGTEVVSKTSEENIGNSIANDSPEGHLNSSSASLSDKSGSLTNGESSVERSVQVPCVPSTSFQFQSDWKTLRNQPEKFFQYFKEIEPSQYVKLFGQALDADILMMVLNTLNNYYLSANLDVYPVLENLARVKRFSMTVMFMSPKEKIVLKDILTHLKSSGEQSASELDSLAKKYEL